MDLSPFEAIMANVSRRTRKELPSKKWEDEVKRGEDAIPTVASRVTLRQCTAAMELLRVEGKTLMRTLVSEIIELWEHRRDKLELDRELERCVGGVEANRVVALPLPDVGQLSELFVSSLRRRVNEFRIKVIDCLKRMSAVDVNEIAANAETNELCELCETAADLKAQLRGLAIGLSKYLNGHISSYQLFQLYDIHSKAYQLIAQSIGVELVYDNGHDH